MYNESIKNSSNKREFKSTKADETIQFPFLPLLSLFFLPYYPRHLSSSVILKCALINVNGNHPVKRLSVLM